MTRLIVQWLDNGIMILAAILLLRFYFKPGVTWLYRKKWVAVAGAFMILYSVVEIGLAYRELTRKRVPSRAELEEAIQANNTLAQADLLYRSPHGYSILVPKGYAYTHFTSGSLSLTATRDTSAIIVARQPCHDALEQMVADTCRYLQKKNPTYAFSDQQSIRIGEIPAIRLGVLVTKEDIPVQSVFLFFKRGNELFQIMCTCPARQYAQDRKQFEGIINSLTIRP
ncbi:MAG: DcrB-related protein [Lentisphaerae bacterium]|nr:DcrB-related protein [Lentisphaerota bacterium]